MTGASGTPLTRSPAMIGMTVQEQYAECAHRRGQQNRKPLALGKSPADGVLEVQHVDHHAQKHAQQEEGEDVPGGPSYKNG